MVMFVTLRQYGYGKSCSSHCENMVMFITFRDSMLCLSNKETQCYIHHIARLKDIFVTFHKYGYVCHIATTKLCSSHCDNMTIFITLRQRGNVRHIETIGICLTLCEQYDYVHHIAMMRLCWSHCEKYGHVHHIAMVRLCSSHYDNMVMFITLSRYGYVRHIPTIWLWLVMFIRLRQYGFLCHILIIWLWPFMFDRL
jgi:hypothetical protein